MRRLAVCLAVFFSTCAPEPESCPSGQVCIVSECGDGEIDAGEACDDQNFRDGDGCSHDCRSNETCGNGIADPAAGEACDDGNVADGDGCSANCRSSERCGNGTVDTAVGEVCDDENTRSLDGCRNDCLSDETCGNGKVDPASGELCDDGNQLDGDSCAANCRPPGECGDGVRDVGEECDEGGATATCDADCTAPQCGDGELNTAANEQCDAGGETAFCNLNCKLAFCGDGVMNGARGEQCDTAGNTGGCDSDCTAPACGDGVINPFAGEECEDGNLAAGDGCNSCRFEVCGNGVPNTGEECDDGNSITETSCPYGQQTCIVCSATCRQLPATGNVCGDGVRDPAFEACDDNNADACGTCSADCQRIQSAHATGLLVALEGSDLDDVSDTFTLDDGLGHSVTFEFSADNVVGAPNVRIAYASGETAIVLRDRIVAAVNAQDVLRITASAGTGASVILTHDVATSLGNQPIQETVSDESFFFSGLQGGAGGDCPIGTACGAASDCQSGTCSATCM